MSYLRHLLRANNFRQEDYLAFYIENARVGWLSEDFSKCLVKEKQFHRKKNAIHLSTELSNFSQRTDYLYGLSQQLKDEGWVPAFMDEAYPVSEFGRDNPLCLLDRASVARFGVRAFGQHLNGYVRSDEGIMMWVGRRAKNRGIYPLALDQLVAGGLPYGISTIDNLIKECHEEAGIDESLTLKIKATGMIRYHYMSEKGSKEDVIFVYDLELPEHFQPVCQDGEVEEFYLKPLDEVAHIVHNTDEFKLNCNLVIIDFLIRHGYITADNEPDYLTLAAGLRSPEFFRSTR